MTEIETKTVEQNKSENSRTVYTYPLLISLVAVFPTSTRFVLRLRVKWTELCQIW